MAGRSIASANFLPRSAMADSVPSDYCLWCEMGLNQWDLSNLPYLTSLHSPSCKFFSSKRKRQEEDEEKEEGDKPASKKLR